MSDHVKTIAMIRALQYIRDNPGETAEQITVEMTRQFNEHMDVTLEWMSNVLKSYEAAGFIRHAHNSEHKCVWLHCDPKPVKKADLREITIEVMGSRYIVFTKMTPSELASAMVVAPGEDCNRVLIFSDISGRDFFVIRVEEMGAVAFGEEVASALQ